MFINNALHKFTNTTIVIVFTIINGGVDNNLITAALISTIIFYVITYTV